MAVLDLQALDPETIKELGLDSNHLWMVKIEGEQLGPFETGALRLHSSKHPEQFDNAHISSVGAENWKPFYSLPQFQRRAPEILIAETDWDKVHYFTMLKGVKDGPYTFAEIEDLWKAKKMDLTDLISWNDGHQWTKLYLHPNFDRRHRENINLPNLPSESSFMRSEAESAEKWDEINESTPVPTALAALAHFNFQKESKNRLNIEEIAFHPPQSDEEIYQSEKRKKVTMSAAAVLVVGAIGATIFFNSGAKNELAMDDENEPQVSRPVKFSHNAERSPASVPAPQSHVPRPRHEVMDQRTQFAPEVYRESHSYDPAPEPYGEVEAPSFPEEHSLVQGNQPDNNPPLDSNFQATDDVAPESGTPVVEEVSDF